MNVTVWWSSLAPSHITTQGISHMFERCVCVRNGIDHSSIVQSSNVQMVRQTTIGVICSED